MQRCPAGSEFINRSVCREVFGKMPHHSSSFPIGVSNSNGLSPSIQ